jgi:UDP:flavonoid glycosyltransferase YjiC (YdhE family)
MASTERAAAFALRKATLPYTAKENAEYTTAVLKSLGAMALQINQPLLAHLLDLTSAEAKWLASRN